MVEPRFADIASSERFESGWNRLQLAVEILVGLIVIGGLAGVFGSGPISPRVVSFDAAPLEMTYERILRRTVPAQLVIRTTAPVPECQVEVELPNQLATDMDVVSTSPRSVAMRAERSGIVYTFAFGAAGLGTITFTLKPRTPGFVRSSVRAGGGQAELRQVVLP